MQTKIVFWCKPRNMKHAPHSNLNLRNDFSQGKYLCQ